MQIITIGREKDNTIVVSDNYVGRHHLQLIQDDRGNYLVTDLNSANGTYVNGYRIAGQVPLKPSDIIRIGNTQLPWQSYFTFKNSNNTANLESQKTARKEEPVAVKEPVRELKPVKESKPINWRNILSAITAVISLLLMLAMLFKSLK